MNIVRYYSGGFLSGATAQNRAEQWTNATQPADPTPAGYTAWDTNGTVTTQRALTGAEASQLAAQDVANIAGTNEQVTLTQLQTDLTTIRTWLANNPNGAVLTAAQTRVLARLLSNLTLYAIQSFATSPVTT